MKSLVCASVFLGCLFLGGTVLAVSDCTDEKVQTQEFLRAGMATLRLQIELLSKQSLSSESLSALRTETEWVLAWTEDILRRLTPEMADREEGIQCAELRSLPVNVRAQWNPILLHFYRAEAEILLHQMQAASLLDEEDSTFLQAQLLLQHVPESPSPHAAHALFSRALFFFQTGVRGLLNSATIPPA